jgi:hypothetical protein
MYYISYDWALIFYYFKYYSIVFIYYFLGHLSHSGDLLLSIFVRCRTSSVNFWTFLASSLEPLNQFQPDLAYSIYGWRGTKIVNFMVPAPLGPWGWGKNYSKLTNFQKSSQQRHMWRKNWIHGDVEQEGLYQNCEIIILGVAVLPLGRGQTWYIVSVNIWTFLTSCW